MIHRVSDIVDQPPPLPNDLPVIADLVIDDIRERLRLGVERYGTPLQPFNGRRAKIDAYQEALDLAMYFRQLICEEDMIAQGYQPRHATDPDEGLPVIDEADLQVTVTSTAVPRDHPGKLTAVRVVHLPTLLVATRTVPGDAPTQVQAKALAVRDLRERVAQLITRRVMEQAGLPADTPPADTTDAGSAPGVLADDEVEPLPMPGEFGKDFLWTLQRPQAAPGDTDPPMLGQPGTRVWVVHVPTSRIASGVVGTTGSDRPDWSVEDTRDQIRDHLLTLGPADDHDSFELNTLHSGDPTWLCATATYTPTGDYVRARVPQDADTEQRASVLAIGKLRYQLAVAALEQAVRQGYQNPTRQDPTRQDPTR